MPSATVRGPYASITTILDPPYFSLDTTFNVHKYRLHGKGAQRFYSSLQANFFGTLSTMIMIQKYKNIEMK
jgi:hypothetical protein